MLGARAGEAGFTLIEVMIAIGIMTVGSLGILSMHHAVSGANRSAHEMNTALAITERWIERVERDSLSWSEPGLNSSTLTGTAYLAPLAATTTGTNWFTPAPALSTNPTDSITLATTRRPLARSNTAPICV